MSREEEKPVGPLIVGNYEVAMQLTQNRTIKITGYIYNNENNAAVDARIDGAMDALDRQFVRADIISKEAHVAALMQGIEDTTREFKSIVDMKEELAKTGKPLPSTQKQKIAQHDHTVRGLKAQVESLQAAIKRGKQKINGALAA